MTNQDKLEKLIQKAIDGGLDYGDDRSVQEINVHDHLDDEYEPAWSVNLWLDKNGPREDIPAGKYRNTHLPFSHPLELIFNHDFAKTLWNEHYICIIDGTKIRNYTNEEGEESWYCSDESYYGSPRHGEWGECDDDTEGTLRDWQYHLQQMVLSDDPISYAYNEVFPDN